VVNKYIGETEKNLQRLLGAADTADLVLFFDEADALFGKRTEVKDSHDRYANLETSHLLGLLEDLAGVVVLGAGEKTDIDPAFIRHMDFVIDFNPRRLSRRPDPWRSLKASVVAPRRRGARRRAESQGSLCGIYRATVADSNDPQGRGRLKVQVPAVFGEHETAWALPCVPHPSYRDLPEPGAAVWVEFEGGDPSRPVWVGCLRDDQP
jgi:hypothetical protein